MAIFLTVLSVFSIGLLLAYPDRLMNPVIFLSIAMLVLGALVVWISLLDAALSKYYIYEEGIIYTRWRRTPRSIAFATLEGFKQHKSYALFLWIIPYGRRTHYDFYIREDYPLLLVMSINGALYRTTHEFDSFIRTKVHEL